MKAEIGKLDIDKSVNVSSVLNNWKTKVDVLDVDKLKTVPADSKELRDMVVKKIEYIFYNLYSEVAHFD